MHFQGGQVAGLLELGPDCSLSSLPCGPLECSKVKDNAFFFFLFFLTKAQKSHQFTSHILLVERFIKVFPDWESEPHLSMEECQHHVVRSCEVQPSLGQQSVTVTFLVNLPPFFFILIFVLKPNFRFPFQKMSLLPCCVSLRNTVENRRTQK